MKVVNIIIIIIII